MLVSIVVPVYNVQKFLPECLESLLNQTYKNIEIILVNDGSKDESLKVCYEYQQKDSRIKVYDKENEGLGLTRNYGMLRATGDAIVFVDSDDTLELDAISRLCHEASSNNADLVIAGHNRTKMDGTFHSSNPYCDECYEGDEIRSLLIPRLIGSQPNVKDSISMSACGVLYRKKLIMNNNLLFLSERKYISEDLLFNIMFLCHVNKVSLISFCGYNYRMNQGTLTTSYRRDRFEKNVELYHFERKLLQENNLLDDCELRLKKQFFVFLRQSIKQEKANISKKKMKDILKQIRVIVNNQTVQDIINSYPIQQLGIQQKVFIYLVKYKCVLILYALLEGGVV